MPVWPHEWEDVMSTPIDWFREICDEQLGVATGQEHTDIDDKPFMYRYDFCVSNTPCVIAIHYRDDTLVGCVQHNGYTFFRKTRCVSASDARQMLTQIRTIVYAVNEPAFYLTENCMGPGYDYVGTWDARQGGSQIEDYFRINEYGAVCAGSNYTRMPLEQMAPVEEKPDAVNAPKHYSWLGNALARQVENVGDVEVFNVLMAAFDKDPLLWQVGKYLLRAGRKDDRMQDLKKARWYLDKAIER